MKLLLFKSRNVRNLFQLINGISIYNHVGLLAIASLLAILETLGVASVIPFLSVAADQRLIHENSYLKTIYEYSEIIGVKTEIGFVVVLGWLSILSITTACVYRVFAIYIVNKYIENVRLALSSSMLSSYLDKPYVFFTSSDVSDLIKNILSEVDLITAGVVRPFINMLTGFLIFIFLVILLFTIYTEVALFTSLSFACLYLLLSLFVRRKILKHGRQKEIANSERFGLVTNVFMNIKYIKFLKLERNYFKDFEKSASDFSNSQMISATISEVPKYVVEAFVFSGIMFAVLLHLGDNSLNDGSNFVSIIPALGTFAFAAYRLQPALQNIYVGVNSLRFSMASIARLHSESNITPYKVKNHTSKIIFQKDPQNAIKLNDISFTYPGSPEPTLKNISVSFRKGKSIGIVGRSGSGKTTLLDVMLGILAPDHGEIEIYYSGLSSVTNTVNGAVAYVPQDIILNNGTILENISMETDRSLIDIPKVLKCLEIVDLPVSLFHESNSELSKKIGSGGLKLSGGQRQRIGIARALYCSPEILILDEATSSLDGVTERKFLKNLHNFMNNLTIISVAHRPNTILSCDQIIFMEDGTVIDAGELGEVTERQESLRALLNTKPRSNADKK